MFNLNNKMIIHGFKRLVHSRSTPKGKAFIYQSPFDGFPKETDLKLVEEDLPPLKDGEFLAEAEYLSLDPYMRGFGPRLKVGTTMIGSQVAIVTESKNSRFPVGEHVVGQFGWRTHTISNGTADAPWQPPMVLPDFQDLPLSLALGVLGMTGNTAFFGFREVLKAKPGETVIVTGAAGAVGSHVTGSDEKGKWLADELKFDGFINYKTNDIDKVLKEIAPEGIDCFFDNVGGELFNIILRNMNLRGRVAACGAISGYNAKCEPKRTLIEFDHRQQVRIEGFQVFRFADRWLEGIQQNMKLIKEGKLKYRETVTFGFHNMFQAFADMLTGGNIGKAVVKI